MNSKFIKKGIVVAALTGMVLTPTAQVLAAEAVSILGMPQQNKEVSVDQLTLINVAAELNNTNLDTVLRLESTEEIRLSKNLSGKAFAVVGKKVI